MPTLISTPTRIEAAGNKPKLIDEYIGRVNSGQNHVSIAHMRSPGGLSNRDKHRGSKSVTYRGGVLDVRAGQASFPFQASGCNTARTSRTVPSTLRSVFLHFRPKPSIGTIPETLFEQQDLR